jgi:hypothetical protein
MRQRDMATIAGFVRKVLLDRVAPEHVRKEVEEFRESFQRIYYGFAAGRPDPPPSTEPAAPAGGVPGMVRSGRELPVRDHWRRRGGRGGTSCPVTIKGDPMWCASARPW